jgi:transcriptional regulator with XRE-family HTH domain
MYLASDRAAALVDLVRIERRAFAAKIRIVRAVLGWSQTELASRVGVTQRAIHKLEQGETEPRRTTVRILEEVWHDEGIVFEESTNGFRLTATGALLDRPGTVTGRRRRTAARLELGVTARGRRGYINRA